MRTFWTLLLVAGGAAAQTYSVTTLAPPTGYILFNLDGAMNNKGQVVGDAGSSGAVVRFPIVWTGGVAQILTIPSVYVYLANLESYKINDAGTVIGTIKEASSARMHIAVWNGATPSILPDAPLAVVCGGVCSCTGAGSSASIALNSAGHILGSTAYPAVQPGGQGCFAYWIYDGANYHAVPYPKPPLCAVSTTNNSASAMNDADQVLESVSNIFCGTNFPTEDPAVIQPSGSYSFLPLGALASHAVGGSYINNLGDVVGFYPDPIHVVVWDANGPHDLGSSGYSFLNNLGQVAFIANPGEFSSAITIWQNGTSTPIQAPAGLPLDPHNPPTLGGFNDAGQIAVDIPGGNGYLLTPAPACGQDVSAQTQVTRGGFRLNHTTQHFTQVITVTNTSASTIAGPISVALDGVPSAATLFGISGDTLCAAPQGSPYLNAPAASLAPGASTSVTLDFIDTASSGITYTTRVLAGPGGR